MSSYAYGIPVGLPPDVRTDLAFLAKPDWPSSTSNLTNTVTHKVPGSSWDVLLYAHCICATGPTLGNRRAQAFVSTTGQISGTNFSAPVTQGPSILNWNYYWTVGVYSTFAIDVIVQTNIPMVPMPPGSTISMSFNGMVIPEDSFFGITGTIVRFPTGPVRGIQDQSRAFIPDLVSLGVDASSVSVPSDSLALPDTATDLVLGTGTDTTGTDTTATSDTLPLDTSLAPEPSLPEQGDTSFTPEPIVIPDIVPEPEPIPIPEPAPEPTPIPEPVNVPNPANTAPVTAAQTIPSTPLAQAVPKLAAIFPAPAAPLTPKQIVAIQSVFNTQPAPIAAPTQVPTSYKPPPAPLAPVKLAPPPPPMPKQGIIKYN